MSVLALFTRGDLITRLVTALLLAMSIASWVVILWKTWLLRRASVALAAAVREEDWHATTYHHGRLARLAVRELNPLAAALHGVEYIRCLGKADDRTAKEPPLPLPPGPKD